MPDDRPYQGRPSSDRPSFSGPRQFSGPRPSFNNNDSRPPLPTGSARRGSGRADVALAALARRRARDRGQWIGGVRPPGPRRPSRDVDAPPRRRVDAPGPDRSPGPQPRPPAPALAEHREPPCAETCARAGEDGGVRLPAAPTASTRPTRSTPDDKVLAVLKDSTRPLAVAAIRKRLGGSFTPQQVRRILERNAPKVSVTDERPATYRLR